MYRIRKRPANEEEDVTSNLNTDVINSEDSTLVFVKASTSSLSCKNNANNVLKKTRVTNRKYNITIFMGW